MIEWNWYERMEHRMISTTVQGCCCSDVRVHYAIALWCLSVRLDHWSCIQLYKTQILQDGTVILTLQASKFHPFSTIVAWDNSFVDVIYFPADPQCGQWFNWRVNNMNRSGNRSYHGACRPEFCSSSRFTFRGYFNICIASMLMVACLMDNTVKFLLQFLTGSSIVMLFVHDTWMQDMDPNPKKDQTKLAR